MTRVLVTGATGFIGHHLCRYLKERGYWVRGVDYKPLEWMAHQSCYDEYWPTRDLRSLANAIEAVKGIDWVFALAADMGGIGFITTNHWQIISNNALINMNTARAVANSSSVSRLCFTSSACAYPVQIQQDSHSLPLKEEDAWQGRPEDAYGAEKLLSEELYLKMAEQTKVHICIARFHNIYGERGAYEGGREKLPAAACRKVAECAISGRDTVSIWGDGEQRRSFCYVDDCVEMLRRLMLSDYSNPMNIGTDHSVSVNEVYDMVARIANVPIVKDHDLSKQQGVRGRNADLALMKKVLGYEPQVSLEEGLEKTYNWVYKMIGGK